MKELEELTLKEHTDLKRSGLMWVIFPEATGLHRNDCKPEPTEPLIVKSGETWVKCVDGINYLWTHAGYEPPEISKNQTENSAGCVEIIHHYWKSFTGPNPDITELTDDIAKIRPMVIVTTDNRIIPVKLYGITDIFAIVATKCSSDARKALVRFATAKELSGAL